MTSTPILGIHRPLAPPAHGLGSRDAWSSNTSLTRHRPNPPRSVPSIPLVDLTDLSDDASDHAHKRQRLNVPETASPSTTPKKSQENGKGFIKHNAGPGELDSLSESHLAQDPSVKNLTVAVEESNALYPLPDRPRRFVPATHGKPEKSRAFRRTTSIAEVQTKPYKLDVPKTAPEFVRGAPADFSPWVGNHPEDTLNEQTARNGYFDKNPFAASEMNTARPFIWPSLKHKSGLQILSSLFISVLDQRQKHGIIASNSTFKPPPRVTLTDTKREAWLRDLANVDIPLRRLSRTIPHGIRGKSLLEHCLNKNISMSRAIWLAKCVGANEIRAFQRKGPNRIFHTGGEAKWVIEWTSNVEQFLESIVDDCGIESWKDRATYGFKLAGYLSSHKLLDQSHFFGWIVASFQASDSDRLPTWLLIVKMNWPHLLRYRCHARPLAEALLDQLGRVQREHDLETYSPLRQRLNRTFKTMVKAVLSCFVLPYRWNDFEPLLKADKEAHDSYFNSCMEQLSARNANFASRPGLGPYHDKHRQRLKLIKILDNARVHPAIEELAQACFDTVDDHKMLISTVIEWATTQYRSGQFRVYLALSLIRTWNVTERNIDTIVLGFLTSADRVIGLNERDVRKLVAELIRSNHFSVSRYFQWLMARGVSTTGETSLKAFTLAMIQDIPASALSSHTTNLRGILMRNLGSSITTEQKTIDEVKCYLKSRIPTLFSEAPSRTKNFETSAMSISGFEQLTGHIKADIGSWIDHSAKARFKKCTSGSIAHVDSHRSDETSNMFVNELDAALAVLGHINDFFAMSNVLDTMCKSNAPSLLDCAAHVLQCHFDIFWAIGSALELFHMILKQHDSLEDRTPTRKALLKSLIPLGERLGISVLTLQRLRSEVAAYDPAPTVAACSPVSDHTVGALQTADSTFVEEMEQLLGSGDSMNTKTQARIFDTLTSRLEKQWVVDSEGQEFADLVVLLGRLRSFDRAMFQDLMLKWIQALLGSQERPDLSDFMRPLVFAKLISLRKVLQHTVSLITNEDYPNIDHGSAPEILELVGKCANCECNTLHSFVRTGSQTNLLDSCFVQGLDAMAVEKEEAVQDSAQLIIELICAAISACASELETTRSVARRAVSSPMGRTTIQKALVYNAEAVHVVGIALGVASSSGAKLGAHLEEELLPLTPACPEISDSESVSRILRLANDFNDSICQVRFKALLTRFERDPSPDEAELGALVEQLSSASSSSISPNPIMWRKFIPMLPRVHATQLHDKVIESLCKMLPDWNASEVPLSSLSAVTVEALLTIIHATVHSLPSPTIATTLAQIDSMLNGLLNSHIFRMLSGESASRPTRPQSLGSETSRTLALVVNTFLRLLAMHQISLPILSLPQASVSSLLLTICRLYMSTMHLLPFLESRTLAKDTVALLSDAATEETRAMIIKTLWSQHKPVDIDLDFILGYHGSDNGFEENFKIATPSPRIGAQASLAPSEIKPFQLKRWEIMADATPIAGENDTSLSLTLFGARKAVL